MTLETQSQPRQSQAIQEECSSGVAVNGVKPVEKKKAEPQCESPKWNYENSDTKNGPSNWLKAHAPQDCGGCQQSPIEICLNKTQKVSLRENAFRLVNYHKQVVGQMLNTGRSVQFLPNTMVEPPEISGGMLDQNYRFIQYHYHWAQEDSVGSEHVLDGVSYPAELHLVHMGVKDPSKLAVLGMFLKLADEQSDNKPLSSEELKAFTEVRKFPNTTGFICRDLASKLPKRAYSAGEKNGISLSEGHSFAAPFIRYDGSLTTPPCTENVTWTVFLDPIPITKEEMKILRSIEDCSGKIIENNCRPVQGLNGRKILFTADH